jgi:formylglycine-generating enzyme required for sulfatase activity
VVSVLEWGISAHAKKSGPDCRGCHGPSRGHVADERNGVKPDRLPRAAEIAGLCLQCHAPKCPKTSAKANCQQCHHVHALLNPTSTQPPEPPTAAPPSAARPRPSAPREFRVADLQIDMLLIPAGEFDMGSERWPSSSPVHTVRVEAFYLGKTEVTQAQWQAVMGTNPSAHVGPRLPVEQVSWNDCQAFLQKLNARVSGGDFRLPTEAEWEYAAGGGAEELRTSAWFRDTASDEFQEIGAYAPRPVSTKHPNRWGLFDMQGNVWEWCSSLDKPYPFAGDGRDSLTAPGKRILRGGSFADSADYLNPSLRHSERPDRRYQWNGLRLARSAARE